MEVRLAWIAGDMHFWNGDVDGDQIGSTVMNWAITHKIQPCGGDSARAAASPPAAEVVCGIADHQACPAVGDEFQDTLAWACDDVASSGTVRVEMGLVGRRIVEVTPWAGLR